MAEICSNISSSLPKVEVEYSFDKYIPKLETWNGSELNYLSRYFSIYDAVAKQGSKYGDQVIYQSPCSLILLSPKHPFLTTCIPLKDKIEKIEFCIDSIITDNPATGKRKKSAARLEPSTEVAVLKVFLKQEEQVDSIANQPPVYQFPICACLQGSMVEMNQKVIDNPFILFEQFEKEAYLGIMLPKYENIPTQPSIQDCIEHNMQTDTALVPQQKADSPTQEKESEDKESKKYRYSKKHRKIAASLTRFSVDPNSPLIYLRSLRVNID
ncbi:hypothetical protein DSO57_1007929 [Entomophthora muscae]|uniref:Uncharacterized protein n=1 Tax=Entomophthora muscae TaxID=34485 RepID=A0ACC2U577_9FUNG|nr:hypothetical protein DSO57_1007929 [Entomophthora muscae]